MKISASTIPSRVASGMNYPGSIAGYGWKSALFLGILLIPIKKILISRSFTRMFNFAHTAPKIPIAVRNTSSLR
jgi:hypothetical protein